MTSRTSDCVAITEQARHGRSLRSAPSATNRSRAFHVFGPKILATRGHYDDRGLESRFITEETGGRTLRADVPLNLPPTFTEEARSLRNKLLLYRFHRRHEVTLDPSLADPEIEPRLNQIMLPLLSVVSDPTLRIELQVLMRSNQAAIVAERGLHVEAQVLEVLAELMLASDRPVVPVAEVAIGLLKRRNDVDAVATALNMIGRSQTDAEAHST
jgi:hypothetical protein